MDMWLNERFDNDYHKVILDGSWPQAVDILERSLAKAKLRVEKDYTIIPRSRQ